MSENGKVTWITERRKLSSLKPWPRNPRQIKTDQAKRLKHFWLECGRAIFCFFVAWDAKRYQVIETIGVLVVSVESMRGNNVMNVQAARFFRLFLAKLTRSIVSLDCLPSLAAPVFSVGYSPSVAMNKSRIIISGHKFGAAFVGATNSFCVFETRWRNNNFFITVRTVCGNLFAARCPPVLCKIRKITSAATINCSLPYFNCELFFALWTYFCSAWGFVALGGKTRRTRPTTRDPFGFFEPGRANRKGFTAISAIYNHLIFSHSCLNVVRPRWRSVLMSRQHRPEGAHIKQKALDLLHCLDVAIIAQKGELCKA